MVLLKVSRFMFKSVGEQDWMDLQVHVPYCITAYYQSTVTVIRSDIFKLKDVQGTGLAVNLTSKVQIVSMNGCGFSIHKCKCGECGKFTALQEIKFWRVC